MNQYCTTIKIVLASLFFTFSLINLSFLNAQEIDWNSVQFSSGIPVQGKINGLNMGGYSYGLVNMQSESTSALDECVQCLDFDCSILLNQETYNGSGFLSMETKPNVVIQTAKLNPSVLRFPGGTHSGWYHLYQYDNNGLYDAANPQIDKGFGMNLGETVHLPNAYEYCKNDSRLTSSQNYIDGFINFINNLQTTLGNNSKTQVTYVANLLTHFNFDPVSIFCLQTCGHSAALQPMNNYDCNQAFELSFEGNEALFNHDPSIYRFELYYKETQDAITYIVDQLSLSSEDILYVEMGNEYYANEGANSGYAHAKYGMSAKKYAQLVEVYAERLQCFFDNKITIKIGVVSKPNGNWQATNNTNNVNYPGLVNLLNQDETNDGVPLNESIDAVILHDYYTKSDCLGEQDINNRFDCAKESLRDHIEGIDGLKGDLDNFKNNFPGKEIWLTEWNMVNGTGQKNVNYINTPLHAAFVMEYALSLLSYNAQNNNIITMATHHRIGFDKPWSVIQTKDGDNQIAVMRASGYVMQYLNKLYDYDNFHYLGNILVDGGVSFDTKEAKTMVFYQTADSEISHDRMLIYYTNKTNNDITYTIPNTISEKNIDHANISYLNGAHLFSYGESNGTHGQNVFKNNNGTFKDEALNNLGYGDLHNQLSDYTSVALSPGEEQILPKNSVGVMVINFASTVPTKNFAHTNLNITLFPNPTQNLLNININIEKGQSADISIFNAEGKVIQHHQHLLQEGANRIELSMDDLVKGVYFLKFKTTKGVVVKRITKL